MEEKIKLGSDEKDELMPRMLVESFILHILGSMISMVLCFYIIYVMMRKTQTARARDPEQVPFLQERYTRVQTMYSKD